MISHGTPYRMWHDLMSARLTRTRTQSYGRPQNVDRRHGDALRGPRQTAARNPATSCGPRADARPGPRALQLARVLLGDRKCRRTLRLVLVGREEAVAREASGRVTAEAGAGLPPGQCRRRSRSSLAAAGRLLELPVAPRQSAARPRIAPARPGAWLERGPDRPRAKGSLVRRCSLGRGLTAASTRPETHFSLYLCSFTHCTRHPHYGHAMARPTKRTHNAHTDPGRLDATVRAQHMHRA